MAASNRYCVITPAERRAVEEIFARSPPISIDCGVLERADNVFVRSSDFGWNDVGTWGSFCELSGKDADGSRRGPQFGCGENRIRE
ncbi:hypothetical protein B5G09_12040 [Alistipes sp. An54]|uniref:hypothetical protein n=1 Tax=Alistipes sp. An54 TaxID=1965645 RepID=UPI000B38721A|nr:hypothetical protein [Alistipes sp. An54]OUN75976.1 hypothetical protein B5G09_12040 [Alistipes sp. An54]